MPRASKKRDGVLSTFEGRDVLAFRVAITNAGDGLSKAMQIDPDELHLGQTVHVVLECEVAKVQFVPMKDAPDVYERSHSLRAGLATIVDKDLVDGVLEQQRVKFEIAQGVHRLPGIADPDAGDEAGE